MPPLSTGRQIKALIDSGKFEAARKLVRDNPSSKSDAMMARIDLEESLAKPAPEKVKNSFPEKAKNAPPEKVKSTPPAPPTTFRNNANDANPEKAAALIFWFVCALAAAVAALLKN